MPCLYRERIIPQESILLKNDIIVEQSSSHIITRWDTLRAKAGFSKGLSFYDLDKSFKVSKFMDDNYNLVYWYCDIIKISYDQSSDSYFFKDLLADLIVYPDGTYHVVDLDELAAAMSDNLISSSDAAFALNTLNNLLTILYENKFQDYQNILNNITLP